MLRYWGCVWRRCCTFVFRWLFACRVVQVDLRTVFKRWEFGQERVQEHVISQLCRVWAGAASPNVFQIVLNTFCRHSFAGVFGLHAPHCFACIYLGSRGGYAPSFGGCAVCDHGAGLQRFCGLRRYVVRQEASCRMRFRSGHMALSRRVFAI